MASVIGFDTETYLMEMGCLAPSRICTSAFDLESQEAALYGVPDKEDLKALEEMLLDTEDPSVRCAHNLSFDLAVLCRQRPNMISNIFDLLIEGKLQCTIIREKLLNLSMYGSIDFTEDAGGKTVKIDYKLSTLVAYHFRQDISESKSEDSWRLRYSGLELVPASKYPQEARDYAIEDSVWAAMLWENQEKRRQKCINDLGFDPFETLAFRCTADFCLWLMACWGFAIDAEEKCRIESIVAEELDPSKLTNLIDYGILIPAEPPQPYANGAKEHREGCPRKKGCDCPIKMTAGKDERISKTALSALIEKVCAEHDLPVERNEVTDKQMTDFEAECARCAREGIPPPPEPQGSVSTRSETIDDIAHYDPVLEEYRHRQSLQKLVSTELPRLSLPDGSAARIVHPQYDVLKRTGRTSSYASKMFPSMNVQNVTGMLKVKGSGTIIDVRQCITSRPGYCLFSVDYSQMELGTLAQKCFELFGFSVLRDKINAGYDVHAYLGAQIARASDEAYRIASPEDPDENYHYFMGYKKSEDEDKRKFFKLYRTFAKPTGLGYPGGLGPDTFVAYAKATYGIIIDRPTAVLLREVWKATYPEMVLYFEFINNECIDHRHSTAEERKYTYRTPYGMVRPNCDYCAAANGLGLQSPSAEGALTGLINVVRAVFDPSMGSILADDEKGPRVRPIGFVHDEIVGEIRDGDPAQRHLWVQEISELMVQGMRQVTPDVEARVEPALMRSWTKAAEPVYDENGILQIWEPKGT